MLEWFNNQSLEHFLRAAVVLTLSLLSTNTQALVAVNNVFTNEDEAKPGN